MIQISITDEEFRQLADYIHKQFGIYLREEKKALVVGRLQQRLQDRGLKSFSEYYHFLIHDQTGEASKELINSISTNHTFFMREVKHFEYLKQQALPQLKAKIKDHDLRIWSAGCSTGEEPYTLAMIIDEFLGYQKLGWDTKVLATDISTRVLQEAVLGCYSAQSIAPLPPTWKRKYFKLRTDGQYECVDSLKNEVIFRKFNLMEPHFPFKRKFHAIFCRNVMIYFDAPTKASIIRKFYEVTEPGGYLFIGHSESLERQQYGYRYVMPSVYQKI